MSVDARLHGGDVLSQLRKAALKAKAVLPVYSSNAFHLLSFFPQFLCNEHRLHSV